MMSNHTRTAASFVIVRGTAVVAWAMVASLAMAQEPATPPASQPENPPASLDDLLDVDGEAPAADGEAKPAQQDDAAAAESKRELDKQLNESEVADAFVQAVEKMSVAAELLDTKFDTGLGTQRVQEDIIAKLSQLLDQAKKNKSSSSSSSSSRQQQQQQQQDPGKRRQQQQQDPGKRRQQQQQQQDQADQRNQQPADNRSEIDPPAPTDANANAVIEETRSEWGNLPQRVRDMLLQGRKEKFSTLYEQLTYEYYKRLAEEGSP